MDYFYKKYYKYKHKYIHLKNKKDRTQLKDPSKFNDSPYQLIGGGHQFFITFNRFKSYTKNFILYVKPDENIIPVYTNTKNSILYNVPFYIKKYKIDTFSSLSDSSSDSDSDSSINYGDADFERENLHNIGNPEYRVDLLMKIGKDIKSDNMYREFLVGLAMNDFKKYFPNWTYTFGYLSVLNKTDIFDEIYNPVGKHHSLNRKIITTKLIDNIIKNPANTFIKSCDTIVPNVENITHGLINNDKSAIFVENIKGITLHYFLENYFTYNEFINILFQIYATLNSYVDEFTHYDLHTGNIMLYMYVDPVKITYNNYIENDTINIYTKFIPVIIDGGRAFVNSSKFNSMLFNNIACTTECNKTGIAGKCDLTNYGMINFIFQDGNTLENNLVVDLSKKNISHDLRLIKLLIPLIKDIPDTKLFVETFLRLDINIMNKSWGTKEIKSCGIIYDGISNIDNVFGSINNIVDFFRFLTIVIKNNYHLQQKNYYSNVVIDCSKQIEFSCHNFDAEINETLLKKTHNNYLFNCDDLPKLLVTVMPDLEPKTDLEYLKILKRDAVPMPIFSPVK